jgi:hypothetical protein
MATFFACPGAGTRKSAPRFAQTAPDRDASALGHLVLPGKRLAAYVGFSVSATTSSTHEGATGAAPGGGVLSRRSPSTLTE